MSKKSGKTSAAASESSLARVGSAVEELSGKEARPARGSRWWKAGKTTQTENPSAKNWEKSAKDELSQFRSVPVVGRLPWKSQYLVLGALLACALLVLAWGALSAGSAPTGAASASRAVALEVLAGNYPSADMVARARRTDGASASAGPMASALTQLAQATQDVQPVHLRLESAEQKLQEAAESLDGQWPALTASGALSGAEGADLALVLGAYREILAGLDTPDYTLAPAIARVNAAFGRFRTSPLATQDVPLTRAWRLASSAWGAALGPLGEWDDTALRQARQAQQAAARAVLDAQAQRPASSSGLPLGVVVVVAVLSLLSLGLLLRSAWKQQQWQLLNGRVSIEEAESGVMALMQDVEMIGSGDLTKRARVSDSMMGTLADAINKTVEQLRRMFQVVRTQASKTSTHALRLTEMSGALIDVQRQHVNARQVESKDVFALAEAVGQAGDISGSIASGVQQVQEEAGNRYQEVIDLRDKTLALRDRVEEALGRTGRLVASSNEIAGMALMLNNIAEQLEILGMQADLQASKAGEAGAGFKVVAKQVKALSEESGRGARQVTSLVETALSDLEALSESMRAASHDVEVGARLSDSTHGAWMGVRDSLQIIGAQVSALVESCKVQASLATGLEDRSRREISQGELYLRQAQEASEESLAMVNAIQGLEESAAKFKV